MTSKLTFKERKRAPIACMNCRTRKLKCRSLDLVENSPCERCVKERLLCEYRPVDQGPASNSQLVPNYPIQDNTVNLYPVPDAPPANQPCWYIPPSTSEGYVAYYPPAQTPLYSNSSYYPTSQYQQVASYPAPAPQYTYPVSPSAYPAAGQHNYHVSPQFNAHHPPNQPTSYHTPTPLPYDHRVYQFDNYGNPIDDSKSAKDYITILM